MSRGRARDADLTLGTSRFICDCQNIAATDDPPVVNTDENIYLRRFVKARDNGDVDGAREAWDLLVNNSYDLVDGFVRSAGRGKLRSEDEIQDAIEQALVRLWRKMSQTFEGTSMGEYVMSTRALCGFAVLDVQRAASKRNARLKSLDKTVDDGEGGNRSLYDAALQAEAERRAAREADDEERDGWNCLLDEYLPQVSNDRYRVVLQRTRENVPAESIAAELDVSMDNLYQLRKRGIDAVTALHEAR